MASRGRSWKMERASSSLRGRSRPRSNKYSSSDPSRKPAPGTRQRVRVWIGGHERDRSYVRGHYRKSPYYEG